MITRKIGKLVRGDATPYQIVTAALLGSLIAFLPAVDKAAGLYVLFAALLLALNANLGVAALVAIPAKLLSLALLPVSFSIGRVLLDGPTSSLFAGLINAPVTAWFGLAYYVTPGGLVLGGAFGALAGLGIAGSLQRLRRKLASLEEGSQRYKELTSKRSVRLAAFVFLGSARKGTYTELLERPRGKPVRVAGLATLALLVVLGFAANGFLTSTYFTSVVRHGLERVNGATVDLGAFDVDLAEGRLRVEGLAMADRDRLELDSFRGLTVEADVSVTDLLRRRVAVDRLVIRGASSGEAREVRGERVGPAPEARPREESAGAEDELSLEEVLADARAARERLQNVRRWLERLAPETGPAGEGPEASESLGDRLARRAQSLGYAEVVATHLIEGAPRFEIGELVVEDLRVLSWGEESFAIRATNLSSDPHLAAAAPHIEVTTKSERITFELDLDGLADPSGSSENRVALALRGFEVDEVAAGLSVSGQRPVSGGTVDLVLDGTWSTRGAGRLDLPLNVSLHDTTLQIAGQAPTPVAHFELPIGVRGSFDSPSIRVDSDELSAALVAAGKDELARRVREETDAQMEALGGEAAELLQEEAAKHGLDTAPVSDEVKTRAAGILGGLIDGR